MCVYSVECDLAIRRDKLGMQAMMRRNLKHITQIQEVMKTEKRSVVSIVTSLPKSFILSLQAFSPISIKNQKCDLHTGLRNKKLGSLVLGQLLCSCCVSAINLHEGTELNLLILLTEQLLCLCLCLGTCKT